MNTNMYGKETQKNKRVLFKKPEKKKPKNVIPEELSFRKKLKKFCDEAGVHGLRWIDGTNVSRHFVVRLIWGAFFLLAVTFAVWKTVINVREYLRHDVNTVNTYDYAEDGVQFPAISLCNANQYRRLVLSRNEMLMKGLTMLYGERFNSWVYDINRKLCPKVMDDDPSDEEANVLGDSDPVEIIKRYGLDKASTMIGMSSNLTVVEMWWENKKVTDWRAFVHDHFTDHFLCSTINPGYQETDVVDYLLQSGRNEEETQHTWITTMSGPNNGLRLLLNVQQAEYCGWFFRVGGAGFSLIIHDQTESLGITERVEIYLHPGRSYDIAIKRRRFLRQTKRLRLCQDRFPNGVDYLRSVCLWLCYIRYVYDMCGCLPLTVAESVAKVNILIGTNNAKVCNIAQLSCFAHATSTFLLGFANSICRQFCNHQCTETVYIPTVSATKLPPTAQLIKWHPQLRNISSDRSLVDKNYISVNIYFESLTVHTVHEFQRVSFKDMWFKIGGNLNLYLGMSFTSLFEPVYLVLLLIHLSVLRVVFALRNLRNKRKVAPAPIPMKPLTKPVVELKNNNGDCVETEL